MSSKFKYCAVPQCKSTTVRTPTKLFILLPRKKPVRKKWLLLARCDPEFLGRTAKLHFCEDHFDLPKDMENYYKYLVTGSLPQMKIKTGHFPSKFECQPDRPPEEDILPRRKKRRLEIEVVECASTDDSLLDTETTFDDETPVSNTAAHQSTFMLKLCRFCATTQNDSGIIDFSSDPNFEERVKNFSALTVAIDLTDSLPTTVCNTCLEIFDICYKFLMRVHSCQSMLRLGQFIEPDNPVGVENHHDETVIKEEIDDKSLDDEKELLNDLLDIKDEIKVEYDDIDMNYVLENWANPSNGNYTNPRLNCTIVENINPKQTDKDTYHNKNQTDIENTNTEKLSQSETPLSNMNQTEIENTNTAKLNESDNDPLSNMNQTEIENTNTAKLNESENDPLRNMNQTDIENNNPDQQNQTNNNTKQCKLDETVDENIIHSRPDQPHFNLSNLSQTDVENTSQTVNDTNVSNLNQTNVDDTSSEKNKTDVENTDTAKQNQTEKLDSQNLEKFEDNQSLHNPGHETYSVETKCVKCNKMFSNTGIINKKRNSRMILNWLCKTCHH